MLRFISSVVLFLGLAFITNILSNILLVIMDSKHLTKLICIKFKKGNKARVSI